jgi:cytochrome c-type biogenesis protein CcmH/NrfG
MPTYDSEHYLAVAAGYFNTGEFVRCAEVCQRGIAEHPGVVRIWDQLGMMAWALEDWSTVVDAMTTVSLLASPRPLARLVLADAYLALGQPDVAVSVLSTLVEADECDLDLLGATAGRLFRAGAYRTAVQLWRRLLRQRPQWAEAHYQLAACLWALDAEPEDLLDPLHEAALLAPEEPRYALALAHVWRDIGSPCDAAEVLATVDPTRIDCPACRLRAAGMFRDVGDIQTATTWEATVSPVVIPNSATLVWEN